MTPNRDLVFGADGGGTKTLGVIADRRRNVLARHQVGPSNPNVVGFDVAADNLRSLIILCCTEAGCSPRDLASLVLGLAGAGSESEQGKVVSLVNERFRASGAGNLPVTVVHDARIALEGAFGGGPGIAVIAGTGSVVIGKSAETRIARVGGWGRALGDEGSGYFIARESVRAVTREIDGMGNAGALREALAERHGLDSRARIVAAVYRENFDLPSLAPTVFELATKGDSVALSVLRSAASQLADQVSTVAASLGFSGAVGVAFNGGLIDHDSVYSEMLKDAIVHRVHGARVDPPLYPPVMGAVIMAIRSAES